MTKEKYRLERRKRGTAKVIAPLIGVHITTLHRRERGELPITKEAELVLLSLPKLKRITPLHNLGRKPGSKSKAQS